MNRQAKLDFLINAYNLNNKNINLNAQTKVIENVSEAECKRHYAVLK